MTAASRIKHVQVQTVSWCNRSCPFCPSQKYERPREFMPLETYERVLAELASIGFAGRFSPYLMGEPLLDRRMPQLLAIASERLPGARLLLQTNGDALSVENGAELYAAGLHKLIINCYDKDRRQVKRMRRLADELSMMVPGLRHVRKSFRWMLRPEPTGRVSREILVEDKTRWEKDSQENWAANVPGIHRPGAPLARWCFRPFEQLYVQHDGAVVLCCCDWKREVVFGNIAAAPLVEVYGSPIARGYRERLLRKDRDMTLCRLCDFSGQPPAPPGLLGEIASRWFPRDA